jgi:protein phosphatase
MKVEVGVATDIGQVRERNEDAYLVEAPLYAVADGMGGHRGGEVASQLALETLSGSFGSSNAPLATQIAAANEEVFARSAEDPSVSGMGTTLTAIVVRGTRATLAHVGDSRAYLLRGGDLRQLTEDHTLVGRMVKAGELSPAEAETHPHRNVLTRVVGTEPEVAVDATELGLMDGDRVLLCSDGLTGMVTEDQIKAILDTVPGAQEAADRLVRAANRAGGVDNITVVLLDVVAEPEDPEPLEDGDADEMPRRRWVRWTAIAVIGLVVLGAGWAIGRAYLDNQWYVGVAGNRVAIYQGIPATVAGFELSRAVEITGLTVTQIERLPFWAGLREGVTARDRADAEQIVEQMRRDLARLQKEQQTGGGGTP